jgi:hypothetical protein
MSRVRMSGLSPLSGAWRNTRRDGESFEELWLFGRPARPANAGGARTAFGAHGDRSPPRGSTGGPLRVTAPGSEMPGSGPGGPREDASAPQFFTPGFPRPTDDDESTGRN